MFSLALCVLCLGVGVRVVWCVVCGVSLCVGVCVLVSGGVACSL